MSPPKPLAHWEASQGNAPVLGSAELLPGMVQKGLGMVPQA